MFDQSVCPTGISGSAAVPHSWVCPGDVPVGAAPTGFGGWCFNSPGNCTRGPNSCSSLHPCTETPSRCATGKAGNLAVLGEPYSFFCESDLPSEALPNGGGSLCFATQVRIVRAHGH